MKKINLYIFVSFLIITFLSSGCKKNGDINNHSDIKILLNGYQFGNTTCENGIDLAISFTILATLKNYSEIPGTVKSWLFNIYKDDTLLLTIDKNNYIDLACGEFELLLDSTIINTEYGYIGMENVVKRDFFGDLPKDTLPNKVEIIVTIIDDSSYTYEISDIYY